MRDQGNQLKYIEKTIFLFVKFFEGFLSKNKKNQDLK